MIIRGFAMMMIYHVATNWDGDDLESLRERHGIDKAYDLFVERWPEAEGLAWEHIEYVHCYATLQEAQNHQVSYGGEILVVDADQLGDCVEIDSAEFAHPIIRCRVPKTICRRWA